MGSQRLFLLFSFVVQRIKVCNLETLEGRRCTHCIQFAQTLSNNSRICPLLYRRQDLNMEDSSETVRNFNKFALEPPDSRRFPETFFYLCLDVQN